MCVTIAVYASISSKIYVLIIKPEPKYVTLTIFAVLSFLFFITILPSLLTFFKCSFLNILVKWVEIKNINWTKFVPLKLTQNNKIFLFFLLCNENNQWKYCISPERECIRWECWIRFWVSWQHSRTQPSIWELAWWSSVAEGLATPEVTWWCSDSDQ